MKDGRKKQEPPTDVTAFGDHMMAAVIPFLIGIALGALLVVALRTAKLRWSWALVGAPLAWPVWLVDWQVGLALGAAVVSASAVGWRWHHDDLERGGSEAREAPGAARADSLGLVGRQRKARRGRAGRRRVPRDRNLPPR